MPTPTIMLSIYGDHEVITSVIDDTTYRYNLENQSVVWKNPNVHGTTSTFELHNGVLYISEGLKTDYASVAAVSIEDGKVMKTYEHEDYKMTHHIRVYDKYLIFFAQPKNDKKNKTELLTFDIKSGKFLWAVPIDGPIYTPVETKDAFLYMDNKTMEDKFNAFDKKTGEKLYTIEAKTNNSEPVVNDTGTYFVDYMESAIYKYDFEGNLLEEMNSSKNLNRYQSIQPIATPNFLVYVEDEAVVWADSNLSHEIQRIEIGETTLLKMFSTDNRIYLITRDGDSDNGEFYAVTLDLETGDMMSKVALELPYQPGFDQAHVYNDKFHFAIHSEGVKERIHYIFSGGDVHKEF